MTKPTILIVDDEADNRHYLSKILSNFYNIITAENGEVGLQKALESSPDLILMDVQMPVLDGFQAFAKLRDHDQTKKTPIIFTSGVENLGCKVKALEGEHKDWLEKPFRMKDLFAKVSDIIDKI